MILTEEFVKIAFVVFASIAILIKIVKWVKIDAKSTSDFLIIQIRYFLCYFAANIPLILQMPFVYHRYIDDGLTQDEIGQNKILYNISAAIFSIFVGPILSFFGHRKLLIFCLFISVIASVLRGIGGKYFYLIASIIIGFSSANVRITFDDWILSEESKINSSKIHFIFVENLSLLQVIISVIVLQSADYIHKLIGTSGIFHFSALLQALALVIVFFFMKITESNSELNKNTKTIQDDSKTVDDDKNKNSPFHETFKLITQSKNKRLILMILLDQTYGTLNSVFWPCVASFFSKKLPTAQISGMIQFAVLYGTLFTGLLTNKISISTILSVSYLLGSVFDVLLAKLFQDKFAVYWIVFGLACCEGSYQSLILKLKGQIYPKHIRSHILGLNRMLQSLFSAIIITIMEKYPLSMQPYFSSCILFMCFVISLLQKITSN